MKIFVEKNEQIFVCEFEQNEKINSAKLQIFKSVGNNDNCFHLVFNDKIFDGDESLTEFGLSDKSLITVVRNEMQILAKTEDEKIIKIYLHKKMKIIDIKGQIQEKIGLHLNEQKLIYQDRFLDDDKRFDEYQISDQSVINIVNRSIIQIIIKTMHTERFLFFVKKMDKIIDLKYKIKDKTELHTEEQILSYNGGILEDDKTIDYYLICDQSLLLLYEKLRKKIKLLLKTMNGEIITILTEKSIKIIDLKYKVEEMIGLNINDQILIYEGEPLSDDKTIDEYQINENSMINIVNKLGKSIQVFIKSVDRESFAITLSKSQKILDVKRKIEKQIKLGRDEQVHIYNGVILEDDKTIDEYQICENSVINIINKSKIEIMINLEIFDGRQFKLCAEKQTKIIDIKKQIEMLIDLYPIKQNLYYQDVLLEGNEDTLEEIQSLIKSEQFSIRKYFTTSLLWPRRGQLLINEITLSVEISNDWLEIFVETTNQIQYKLFVFKNETIFDIKHKIYKEVNVEPNEQILFYNELILENNKTVEQSNIVDKVVLRVEFNLKNWINIYMNILNGNRNMGKLDLMTTDKLGDLKCDIEEKIGINRDAQILMYNGEILLDDDKTVNQYQITNNSIIDIKFRNEYTITCDEDDYLKMGDIKKVIKNKTQINKEQKIVIYSSNFNNNKLIFEYEIKNKEKRKVNCKLKKFIEAIKSESIDDVQMYYEKSLLEMKYGSYFRHPIHYACKLGLRDIVKYLIEKGCNLEAADSENRRPIHYVCAAGNVELLNILIQHNVNIEASDLLNRRPIHIACFKENLNIITKLIEKNCDQEACDYQNRRPIHYSCTNGNVEIIEFLIENNCDIESADNSNRSPLMIAQENNSEIVVEILYKEMRTRRNIRMVADAMKLECAGDDCDHKFCRTSMLSKKFKGIFLTKGSFGKIYLCHESKTSAHFVYKRFDNDSISSKYIEGNINDFMDKIKHEKIIEYVGGFEIKKNKFIFMEYVKEGSLKGKIEKANISLKEIIYLTKQLLEALEFLHGKQIIHRDIKPDNALVDGEGNLKLIDFGSSLPLSKVGHENRENGTFCGTIYYIAPEMLNDEKYSCSVDIWSLGITVIEMAKGKKDIKDHVYFAEVIETRTVKYELPDSLENSNDLEILIKKMLHRDGSNRPSATELLKEFTYFQNYLYK